jgi:uncharacterized membrane protein YjjB (DUF3815 family)
VRVIAAGLAAITALTTNVTIVSNCSLDIASSFAHAYMGGYTSTQSGHHGLSRMHHVEVAGMHPMRPRRGAVAARRRGWP